MKNKFLLIGLTIGVSLALAGGCASTAGKTIGGLFFKGQPLEKPGVTNAFPVYAESDIQSPAVTNFQTGIITPPVAKTGSVPISIQPVVIVPAPGTHYENGPVWGMIEAGGSMIPGYGWLITGVGGLLSVGIRNWLNRREKDALKTFSVTTIQSIETFVNGALASGDPKAIALAKQLKTILETAHDYAGVEDVAAKLIDQYTGHSGSAVAVATAARS